MNEDMNDEIQRKFMKEVEKIIENGEEKETAFNFARFVADFREGMLEAGIPSEEVIQYIGEYLHGFAQGD